MLIFWNYVVTRKTPEQPKLPTPVVEREEVKEREPPKEITTIETAPETKAALDTIDTPIYRAILNARGATIQSIVLKEYKDPKGNNVELIRPGERALADVINLNGKLLDLKDAVFKVVERTPNKLVYSFTLPSGEAILKEYSFVDTSYMFSLYVTLPKARKYKISWDAGLKFTERYTQDELRFFAALAHMGGGVVSKELNKLKNEPYELQGDINWVGTKNKYFLAAIVPDNVRTEKCSMMRFGTGRISGGGGCCAPYAQCGAGGAPKVESEDTQIGVSLVTECKAPMHFRIYVGPLDYDSLKKFGVGLQEACYLGFKWIRPISKFILTILLGLHKVIRNYGVVIIVFSFIISIVFFPLTRSQQKSMKGLAKLQPKLQALQKKYKNNPQALNRATMELYRKHKVNPLGGCLLPLIIQMPIFVALYAILSSTIELRGASFLWVPDLSQRDPYYILPILMGATMLINTRIQPQQQSQQRMFTYMMPIIFTFFFLSFPAGLVLYWFVYNVFSIVESYMIRRTL